MNNMPQTQAQTQNQEGSEVELDLDSDEPIALCPMRKDGTAPGDICEACQ